MDWIGFRDWIGLDWIELVWFGLDGIGLVWIGLKRTSWSLVGLDWNGSDELVLEFIWSVLFVFDKVN